ncbi:YqcC family protein [Paraglaciecola sp. 25GB23A]|uniref:YqcC family protein n=1 Tax=Paraglaciecola sp. 25GB23A TaxID=3156068 RepID=UPI0032AFD309
MPRSLIEVEALLQQLEHALQHAGCWSAKSPTSEALHSSAPFACDHLRFEQWLQFIFIPKLREHLTANKPLPNAMGLHPMGEQCFSESLSRATVLPVLAQIDLFFKV